MSVRMLATVFLLGLAAPLYCTAFSVANPSQIDNKLSATALQMGLFGGETKPAGPPVVMEIPVESIKPKPLRFFLQIYIVGDQNTKESQSWLPRESDDGGLQVYYKDGTGMCNIVLEDDSIMMERHGQRPSLEYLLQESLMLRGILDELDQIANGEADDVEENQRLLKISKEALDKAREKLPARQD